VCIAYFEHALVKGIRSRLSNRFSGGSKLICVPVVLSSQELEFLLTSEGSLKTLHPAIEVVGRLVKDRL
jgi:DNA-binding transcriptional regulator LsrR (DeoR family)